MRNIYSIFLLLFFTLVNAQNPSDLLESFVDSSLPLNYYYYKNNPENGSKPLVAVQPDGKILVNSGNGLERISNNVKDLSFNTGSGFSKLPYYSWNPPFSIDILVVQPDGKILIGGTNFTHYNGVAVNKLIRLNSDGSLDTSFNVSVVWDLVVQPNGKIVVLGRSDLTPELMFRLENDGTLDPTFNVSAFQESKIIELQADGKLLVTKNSYSYASFKRFNSDGSSDLTFNASGSGFASGDKVYAVATQADGKIILGGEFTTYNGVAVTDLIRLNIDGSLDTTFSLGSVQVYGIKSIVIDSQGRLLIGSENNIGVMLTPASGNLIRLDANGALDTSFVISSSVNGYCSPSVFNGVALQPDGKIIMWKEMECSYLSFKFQGVGRLNADGSIDNTFNTGGGFNDKVNVLAIQADNKILVGGDFNTFKGETFNYILRLNPDYSIDRTFNTGSGFNGKVNTIVVQPDGKILVGGNFFYYNGFFVTYLIRLNQDGSIDPSLVAPVDPNGQVHRGPDGEVRVLTLQPDGKILIGGVFRNYYDAANVRTVNNGLMRLNTNNTVDTGFDIGVYGFDDTPVNAIALDPSGKIIVGGAFQRVSCCGNYYSSSKYIVTLNSNGTIFSTSTSLGATVNAIVPDFNGSMLVGTDSGLVRYTGTGYTPTITGAVKTITLQPDGKILIGGNITACNGLPLNGRFARLNRDASLDVDFDSRNLFNGTVYAIKLQPDGKIITGGHFTEYRGIFDKKLAVLRGDAFYTVSGSNRLDLNADGCDVSDSLFPNLEFQISNGQTQIPNTSGNYLYSLSAGNYTVTPVLENPTYFNVAPSSVSVNFPSQGNVVQDFCITPNGVHSDIEVALLPITPARPGFDAKYKLVYKNKGNQLESGTVNLAFDDTVLDFVNASPSATSQATNLRSWNFANLKPYETKEIMVTLNLNTPTETPPLTGGSVLNYVADITSQQTDETPNDNTFSLNQNVVNSYDPNDKTCLQGTTVGPDKVGEYVHYVIRFENTGTYAAQNITIRDFIDADKFDISTLVPVKGSHLFTTEISEGNKVEFVFQNINLPYTAGTNTGYVAFKIKIKPTLVSGDTFSNGAGIYFDYNYPITTNTYVTTIQALSTQDFSFGSYLSLYPNPVSETLNISKKSDIEIQSMEIYNALGQIVLAIPNAKELNVIDVSNFASGTYFVKINSNKGSANTKFVKK